MVIRDDLKAILGNQSNASNKVGFVALYNADFGSVWLIEEHTALSSDIGPKKYLDTSFLVGTN